MQVHFVGRDEILEKLHSAPHGDLNIQAAANPHGRTAEESIFVNGHVHSLWQVFGHIKKPSAFGNFEPNRRIQQLLLLMFATQSIPLL
jgi:hypothetical protein